MQNPNEDTQWNDVLRAKGILPPKEEPAVTEDTVVKVVMATLSVTCFMFSVYTCVPIYGIILLYYQ